MTRLLVLRPEPGAARTVAAARALGLTATAAPLFSVEPVDWGIPPGDFDALMLTSAQGARLAGGKLDALRNLPVHAVGAATAAAARAAGLAIRHVGSGDAADLVAAMTGVRRVLHLAGEAHRAVTAPGIEIVRAIVYRAVPVEALPVAARDALADRAIVLLHSPAAGALFARLFEGGRASCRLAAISPAAAAAAGAGWADVAVAAQPSDAALLAVAAKLCEEGDELPGGRG